MSLECPRRCAWAELCSARRSHYPTHGQNTEKPLPAGIAPVGWNPQRAFHPHEKAPVYAISGYGLKVKIAAPGTMRIAAERDRDTPRIEPAIAGMASPGSEAYSCGKKVENSVAVGPVTIATATLGTNHFRRVTSRADFRLSISKMLEVCKVGSIERAV